MLHRPGTIVWSLLLTLLLIPAVGVKAQARRPSTGFEVGQPFPAIALPALEDGRPGSLADFRGKKLLLHVFASW